MLLVALVAVTVLILDTDIMESIAVWMIDFSCEADEVFPNPTSTETAGIMIAARIPNKVKTMSISTRVKPFSPLLLPNLKETSIFY